MMTMVGVGQDAFIGRTYVYAGSVLCCCFHTIIIQSNLLPNQLLKFMLTHFILTFRIVIL